MMGPERQHVNDERSDEGEVQGLILVGLLVFLGLWCVCNY